MENMTLLGCGNWEDGATEDCLTVACNIYNVRPNSQLELISFQMQLNVSQAGTIHLVIKFAKSEVDLLKLITTNEIKTLVDLLGEKRTVLLESLGSVDVFKESKAGHKATSFAQSIVQFNQVSIASKTPLWVYILSGLGGLILLFLIAFCLFKVKMAQI